MDLVSYKCPPIRQILVEMGSAQTREAIISIEAIQLYFVTSGRNAWHKKWIKRYKPGSMNLTLAAAKNYAESLRTNGSVFYIQVLPAVLITTPNENYIVTQINTDSPLLDYSCIAQRYTDWNGKQKHPKHLECYVRKGGEIDYALETFQPSSRHWEKKQPNVNSVMIFGPLKTDIKVDNLKIIGSPVFQSKSVGGNCRLAWVENGRVTYSRGVELLIKQFEAASKDDISFEKPELPDNVVRIR